MKVSIIVPVYNVEKYIEKCLISIKNQSIKDFECLIIDDGSTDNSILIAEELIKDDIRFTIYHKENGGLSDARNYGLDLAIGDYILFVDSDDYIDRKLLEKAYLMAYKYDSDIVSFDLYYEYPDGRLEVSSGGNREVSYYLENHDLIFQNNSANNKLFRRTFLNDKRFIKEMLFEDLASIPVWMAKANNVSYVNEPLYYYVQRDASISHSYDERIFRIYDSISNIKSNLSLSSKDISELYYKHGLIATTLKIRNIDDEKKRKEFYLKNIDILEKEYPSWYEDLNKDEYNFKQKIIFYLLKHRRVSILDKIYNIKG